MQLVILAAGRTRRSDMVDVLAAVGPGGEALVDYTALDAVKCGFKRIVLVAPKDVKKELAEHVNEHWPKRIEYELVAQSGAAGTAQAVRSAARLLEGPFGVANAADYYGPDALEQLCNWLESAATESKQVRHLLASSDEQVDLPHVLLGFRLADTVPSTDAVDRGVCRTSPAGELVDIVEQKITKAAEDGGGGFAGKPPDAAPGSPAQPLSGDELVSMNLWGFYPRMNDHLAAAVKAFSPAEPAEGGDPPELLLPDVVMDLVRTGADRVAVVEAKGQVIGISSPGDLELARSVLQARQPGRLAAPKPDNVPKNVP